MDPVIPCGATMRDEWALKNDMSSDAPPLNLTILVPVYNDWQSA